MKPTHFMQAPERSPTVGGVIETLRALGADRGAVVLPPEPTEEAALSIFMLGNKAIREVGSILLDFAREHRNDIEDAVIPLTMDTTIAKLLNQMNRAGTIWHYAPMSIYGKGSLLVIIIGTEYCRRLAPKLTAAGCIVNLQPTSEL